MVYQAEAAECSLACLSMIAGAHGHNVSVAELRRLFPISLRGLSVKHLIDISQTIGIDARPVRCEIAQLHELKLPAMLHWDLQHFVVLCKISGNRFLIHDPGRGVRKIKEDELSKYFTGVAIDFSPTEKFAKKNAAHSISLRDLIGPIKNWRFTLLAILLLSALLESLLLAQPIFIRSIVDLGVTQLDRHIVKQLTGLLVFAGLLVGAITFLRDFAVLRAGTALNFDMMRRLFGHILRLPLPFFEKRPIGHLVERYRVTNDFERFVVSSLPLAIIDGVMTLVSIVLVALISPVLALIPFLTLVVYAFAQAISYRDMRSKEEAMVWAKGEESGFLIETLRSVFTTKVNGLENNRFVVWENLYSNLIGAQKAYGLIDLSQRSVKTALLAINVAVLLYVAASLVLASIITVGSMFAVLFYNAHFLLRSTTLVERLVEFKLLGVRLDRIEDIVLASTEEDVEDSRSDLGERATPISPTLKGGLAAEDVFFRYGPQDPMVLRGANLRVASGEFVALVGDNGAGKTTLFKLMLGLYRPTEGTIRFDGQDLGCISVSSVRRQLGVVAQDDRLYAGTLAENISLFDADVDMDRVAQAANLATILEDIENLPMGFNTRIGDLGSPFSEGQTQKLYLARALYNDPPVLLMDEGTANLDRKSEQQILANLGELQCTKVLIAHRSATIRAAHRVLLLECGAIADISHSRDARIGAV